MTADEKGPPALPGEVWRDQEPKDHVLAVTIAEGWPRGYIWLPAPNGFWSNSPMALSKWALAERARAEAAEARAERAEAERDRLRRVVVAYADHARNSGWYNTADHLGDLATKGEP